MFSASMKLLWRQISAFKPGSTRRNRIPKDTDNQAPSKNPADTWTSVGHPHQTASRTLVDNHDNNSGNDRTPHTFGASDIPGDNQKDADGRASSGLAGSAEVEIDGLAGQESADIQDNGSDNGCHTPDTPSVGSPVDGSDLDAGQKTAGNQDIDPVNDRTLDAPRDLQVSSDNLKDADGQVSHGSAGNTETKVNGLDSGASENSAGTQEEDWGNYYTPAGPRTPASPVETPKYVDGQASRRNTRSSEVKVGDWCIDTDKKAVDAQDNKLGNDYTLVERRSSVVVEGSRNPSEKHGLKKFLSPLKRLTYDTPGHEEDVIIAVMGPTGSGKSTFISNITGHDEGIGHSLHSFTKDINVVRITMPHGWDVVLVDTPGFNDTDRSDLDILKQISNWLESSYHKKNYLSELLYFHRISDNRMAGTAMSNLEMFQKLCGRDSYDKVSIVTTMWEQVDRETGQQRIRELSRLYWRKLLDGGAEVRELDSSPASARAVLGAVLSKELKAREIRIQRELAVLHKQLPDTGAGRQLRGNIEKLVERQQDLINRMVREVTLVKDPEVIASLLGELQELRRTREEAIAQMAELRDSKIMKQLRNIWMFLR